MNSISRGKMIRRQVLRDVRHHPSDLASHISQIFSISRQASNKHIRKLLDSNWLEASGTTRNRVYQLGERRKNSVVIQLSEEISEHNIFLKEFSWVVEGIPKNVEDIVFYGFTEMVNNAIEHSEGTTCYIMVSRDKEEIKIFIIDDGEGIFRRVTRLKELIDERQALLELYKGKFTTDPENHSGQGIFFTSRMFDSFTIFSHELAFSHQHNLELDYLSDNNNFDPSEGTIVVMKIKLDSLRIDREVFEQYSGGEDDDFAFNKTVIPVAMAKFGEEKLVSRSQAKRLLTRIENFKYVLFDFSNVDSIGQAFADEIFRVYRLRNEHIQLGHDNANKEVITMIKRAENELKS